MFEAKLQMRLQSSEPKCSNCGHWVRCGGGEMVTVGTCTNPINVQTQTTDLTVCSAWQPRPC